MAISNKERLGKALDILRGVLGPHVHREVRAQKDNESLKESIKEYLGRPGQVLEGDISDWDISGLTGLMLNGRVWNIVFHETMGFNGKNYISEIKNFRNDWAHQKVITSDNAARALDTIQRLLELISAPEALEIAKSKMELNRQIFDEQLRNERRKSARSTIDYAGGLKPWREVIRPHADVQSGKYQQAEFAADLWQVHKGEAVPEYSQPKEFFRRTYITEGLKELLINAVRRICTNAGDPVVQLQTNFGGGKTHSMLALYHLVSGIAPAELQGLDEVMIQSGVQSDNPDNPVIPKAKRVVLVGNKISPANPSIKPDGVKVHTLWGEIAYQLGGKEAYERIRLDDEKATNPGDILRDLFNDYGPSIILIDEWVAYARQLHDDSDMAGGSFATQFTFAQTLTEAARGAKNTLLIISLPASTDAVGTDRVNDEEVGGIRGRTALEEIDNVVKRVSSSWRPASSSEGFEIVRRRLFEPITEKQNFINRDFTASELQSFYEKNKQDFPEEARDYQYQERIKSAYPIHPEVFDLLYSSWSTLVRFQRTRGVLRLMAAVIHSLWERGSNEPIILPSHFPIDDPKIREELTRYLKDNWLPIIESDVDGENSMPLRIEREIGALGTHSVCRRLARTLFLATAPTADVSNNGIDETKLKLGSVLPGEPINTFGDGLRRLQTRATHLYHESGRYWISTEPTVNKTAEQRAEALKSNPEKVHQEIEKRLLKIRTQSQEFSRTSYCFDNSTDFDDEPSTLLVVFGPLFPCDRNDDNPAVRAAQNIFTSRGNSPRVNRNAIVFLAPDDQRLADLEEATRQYLAWASICEEHEALNLKPTVVRQAESQRNNAENSIKARIPEVYRWVIYPTQLGQALNPVAWEKVQVSGTDDILARVVKKLKNEDEFVTRMSAASLVKLMDSVPLWKGNHISVKELASYFYQYTYLPRVQNSSVILDAILDGVSSMTWSLDTFAYADSYDEATDRYVNLKTAQQIMTVNDSGLIVKRDVAAEQLDRETTVQTSGTVEAGSPSEDRKIVDGSSQPLPFSGSSQESIKDRYFGVVKVDPAKLGRQITSINDEVIRHLVEASANGKVTLTLNIEASIPDGANDSLVRTVLENGKVLGFETHGFE